MLVCVHVCELITETVGVYLCVYVYGSIDLAFTFYPRQLSGEGNVFSLVCLSVHKGGGIMCPIRTLALPPLYRALCPSLYKALAPSLDVFKLVHYVARSVGKRGVGIRLKCLLFIFSF